MKRVTYEEIILSRVLMLNNLMPHYWSELFILMSQMLDEDETRYLNLKLKEVEDMVLSDDDIKHGKTLYDIEMAIESNPDYYAFFKNPRKEVVWTNSGMRRVKYAYITKFDVERELNKVKQWIFAVVRGRAEKKRFSRAI